MKIAVIIANYNKKELLNNCLKSLRNNNYSDFKVIVVDNGSGDDSCKLVELNYPETVLIKMGYNSGFCKANNIGIDYALKNNFQFVVVLNNDTEVDQNFLDEIVKKVDLDKRIGMISSKIILFDGKNKIDSIGLKVTPDGLAKNEGLGNDAERYNRLKEVFCPAGAAALYTKELLESIKQNDEYFDNDFEFYFEELDLGWRARLRGWECVYAPKAIVHHHKSATAGAYSEFVAYYTNRNIFFNIIKNYPAKYALRAIFLSVVRYFMLLFGFLRNNGPGYKIKNNIGFFKIAKVTIRGFYSVIINFPKMIKKRSYIQKNKKVSDKEIKRWFKYMGLSFLESIYK